MIDFMTTVADAAASVRDKKFLEDPLHRKARQDFKELCQSKTGYMAIDNMNFQRVKMLSLQAEKDIGLFLPIGHEMTTRKVEFPADLLDHNDSSKYVVVMGYSNNKVMGAYVFKATSFTRVEKVVPPPIPPYSKAKWLRKIGRGIKAFGAAIRSLPSKFKMYKYDTKTERFVIMLPGGLKLKSYSFGHALRSIQK